jgi:DNA polymerase
LSNSKLKKYFILKTLQEELNFFAIDFLPKTNKKDTQNDKINQWQKIKIEVQNCNLCELSKTRTKVVFGEGNEKAKVMIIGEAPGGEEDIQGRPFVGRAGKLLDQVLTEINWNRNEIYITNLVKCRPPENRLPSFYEISKCSKYLKLQIEFVNPSLIILLGAPAAQTILGTYIPNLKGIKEIRGNVYEFNGKKYLPTFHPAYILRNQKDYLIFKEDILKARKIYLELLKNKS